MAFRADLECPAVQTLVQFFYSLSRVYAVRAHAMLLVDQRCIGSKDDEYHPGSRISRNQEQYQHLIPGRCTKYIAR
jgi:hypothetical protein